jgi:hypothetical protein
MTLPNLDISTAVQTAFYIAVIGVVITIWIGLRSIQAGKRLTFFRKRQVLIERGYRMFGLAVVLGGLAFFFSRYAEPMAYTVFPPSPTVTQTSTVTATATITPTSTITPTPSITPTTSITPTPFIPTDVYLEFTSVVTPNPAAVFSKPQVAKEIDKERVAVNPAKEFANPVGKLYAAFSYDKMTDKAQWTATWVRLADLKMVCFETLPWNGSTGGCGYTECNPPSDQWQAGDYEIAIFVGTTFKISTYFSVTGTPPTPTITLTPIVPTGTPTPTYTITPLPPTLTLTATNTPVPPLPTWTPWPTDTRWPSMTPTP